MRCTRYKKYGTVGLLLVSCNNPSGASGQLSVTGSQSGEAGAASSVGDANEPPSASFQVGIDSFVPFGSLGGAPAVAEGGAGGGDDYPPDDAVSTVCGDRIVGKDGAGKDEECDDGDEGSDACTADCQTRDQPAIVAGDAAKPKRYLGVGRHPLSGSSGGFAVSYVDLAGDVPAVAATLFNRFGQRVNAGAVSADAAPIQDANPVTAALPNGDFAIAWTDFDGDGSDLGIALRRVTKNQLGPLGFANAGREFSQRDADLLWTGDQLVAAWVDFSDADSGPDLRYRLFDANLNPLSSDLTLADTIAPEAAVALTSFQGSWAAAYREGTADGHEYVVVKSGEQTTRVGPILGGPIDDRPALVELDAQHLLVVFSEALAPPDGPANFTRLAYAVVDSTTSTTSTSQPLAPLERLWRRSEPASQVSPSAERGPDGVYVAWRSEARPGDAAGDQLWLKYLTFTAASGAVPAALHVDETEMLIPRTCEGSVGDQRVPALLRTPLPPQGALALAWEDYGRTQGDGSGQPEVLVHFAPTRSRGAAQATAQFFDEAWDAAIGTAWSNRWTGELTGPFTVTTQRDGGQIVPSSTTSAIALEYVNDKTALNVDLVSDIRVSMSSRAGLFTRRADVDPDSYLAFQFGSARNEPWRTYAMIDGVRFDIQTLPPSNNVPVRVADQTYRVRFRTATQADGSLLVAARIWPVTATEPTTWSFQKSLAASSVIAQRFVTPGRFGVLARPNQLRKATFDDFQAKFFEGSQQGDLDAVTPSWPLPLQRSLAHYRRCTAEAPCEDAGGCCETAAECAAGAACSAKWSANQPLGSHADACVVEHCSDGTRNGDEERADCGGADCAPCSCSVSATSGTAAYCPTTCPCGTGDASCTLDAHCVSGLSCSVASGPKYGWAAGVGSCTPFHCANDALDIGETWPDCGGECGACTVVEVTPTAGSISATAGALQKILASSPTKISTVANLAEGQTLCLFSDSSQVSLDAVMFNRIHDYTLVAGVPACFLVDGDLVLQSTNLPEETFVSPADLGNLDWQLSNEPARFQLTGTNITRWLASPDSVHDAVQTTASLQPTFTDGGALMAGIRYMIGVGTPSDWTFLHRPGVTFVVFRLDTAQTGYLFGTVHDSSASGGSGFGIYVDGTTDPPRLRVRVGNGTASYAYGVTTTRVFTVGPKHIFAVNMTNARLETFKNYDSIGSEAITGTLSTAAPYSVPLIGAKASTSRNPLPGALFEIDHFSGALSQRARQAVVQYLAAKHGVE